MIYCYALDVWDCWNDTTALLRLTVNQDVMASDKRMACSPLSYQAGQYIDVHFPGESIRPYSIATAPRSDGRFDLHMRHRSEDAIFSQFREQALALGQVSFSGPYGDCVLGRFFPQNWNILVVQGTGFAPANALIEASLAAQDGRLWHVFWQGRSQESLYCHKHLCDLVSSHRGILRYTPVLSENDQNALDHRVLCREVIAAYNDLSPFCIYLSGMPAMVFESRDFFVKNKAKKEHILSDYFNLEVQSLAQ
jgi:CDP-4-dehydro-6-deoxyglucose reductase, E3